MTEKDRTPSMASSQEKETMGEDLDRTKLPQILIHRYPPFTVPCKHRLLRKFQLLEPDDSILPTHSFLAEYAQSVRVILCVGPSPVDSRTLDCFPSLQCVVGTSAGVDHIDLAECSRRGISVTSAGDAFSDDVADYAVGLLFDVLRRISASNRYVRAGLWPLKGDFPLGSKVLLLIYGFQR